ncbi:transposase [Streptomyces sp. NPDC013012]|uniref:transposase n=1 Tax=Streptomyces sp. NPDC013012 TaxID=3364860 RepID=UPI0036AB2307
MGTGSQAHVLRLTAGGRILGERTAVVLLTGSCATRHPDAGTILNIPRLGIRLGAQVPAEIGDDRQRFTDARGPKAYASASPVVRASGKMPGITRRG